MNSCTLHLLEEVLDGREGAGVLLIGAVGGVHSGAGLVIHLVTLPGGGGVRRMGSKRVLPSMRRRRKRNMSRRRWN